MRDDEFRVGDAVQVRPGILDADYPDMPMGGWKGTIIELYEPNTCLVQWSDETLRSIHPVFKNRCENDGLDVKLYCFEFGDLELDQGGPPEIEQPTSISTRALSPDDEDDRIRIIFGLTSNDVVPAVSHEAIELYHRFLNDSLEFPVVGQWRDAERVLQRVQLNALAPGADLMNDEQYGILCDVRLAHQTFTVALDRLENIHGKTNARLLSDYCHWLHNYF